MAKAKVSGNKSSFAFVGLLMAALGILGVFALSTRVKNTPNVAEEASAAITAYSADFTKFWGVRTAAGSADTATNQIYYKTGVTRGYLHFDILGATGGNPAGAGVYLPYKMSATGTFTMDVDTQLITGSDYNTWVRVSTNLASDASDKVTNGYIFSIHPATKAYEILKMSAGVPTTLAVANGVSAIKTNDQINHFQIVRNQSTGDTKFYVNATLVKQFADTSFKGGYTRLSTTGYSSTSKARFSKFTVK